MTSRPIIEIDDLGVAYPDGRVAVDGVSLRIESGSSVALLGANGAGKSSLLLALVGILPATGEIRVGGVPLSSSTLAEIRRSVQLVFQDPNDQLFMPVLRDDIAFGPLNFGVPAKEVPELVSRSLSAVGLEGFEDRNPHNLSVGERTRAALAAALACAPDVLLLDEPSAALDPRGRRQLVQLLSGLDATKVIATHDLLFAEETCDSAVLMAGGRIVAGGPTKSLLSDSGLLRNHGLL